MITVLIWLEYCQGADSCGHGNEHSVSPDGQKISLLVKRL